MSVAHYVVTTRRVGTVKVDGLPDQFWYASDDHEAGDLAAKYMRCGRYTDNDGKPDAPWFFDHEGEDEDYHVSGKPSVDKILPKGGSEKMLSMLFDELEKEQKDLLIFNFGYENRREKELGHLVHLHEKYIGASSSKLGKVLMITWPSQGFGEYNRELGKEGLFKKIIKTILGRTEPRNDAGKIKSDVQITGEALAIFLLKLKNFTAGRYKNAPEGTYRPKFHFIVQSMANVILEHCSRTLNTYGFHSELHEFFNTIMLTSPDVRNDIFELSPAYYNVAKFAKRTYVVCSEDDTILKAADIFHNIPGTRRLGLTGPHNMMKAPANVFKLQVKQSKISFNPVDYNHRYFQYNAVVIDHYLHIFNEGHTHREESISA